MPCAHVDTSDAFEMHYLRTPEMKQEKEHPHDGFGLEVTENRRRYCELVKPLQEGEKHDHDQWYGRPRGEQPIDDQAKRVSAMDGLCPQSFGSSDGQFMNKEAGGEELAEEEADHEEADEGVADEEDWIDEEEWVDEEEEANDEANNEEEADDGEEVDDDEESDCSEEEAEEEVVDEETIEHEAIDDMSNEEEPVIEESVDTQSADREPANDSHRRPSLGQRQLPESNEAEQTLESMECLFKTVLARPNSPRYRNVLEGLIDQCYREIGGSLKTRLRFLKLVAILEEILRGL